MPYEYETNGAAIYEQSFRMIRAESDLTNFNALEEQVAVRMIHAAGLVDLAKYIKFSNGFVTKARAALNAGAPIFCDARMVSEGITRARLPDANEIICTLHDPNIYELAADMNTTPIRGRFRILAPPIGRISGGNWQRANCFISPFEYARRSHLPAPCGNYRMPRRLCRSGGE